MAQAVVFDIGGVLIDWDPRHLYRDRFAGDEAAMEEFLATVCTPAWNAEQDRGRAWDLAVAELTRAHRDHAEHIAAYHSQWSRMVRGTVDGTPEVVRELRSAGVPVYALTNWSAEKFAETRERFPFLGEFDGIVVSGEVGLIKPDPAVFRLALDRFGLAPADTVFVDDSQANIDAAAELGITALRFTGAERLREDLRGLGLLPDADRTRGT